MISKSLGSSRRFRELLDIAGSLGEFAQSLYALLIAHADDWGRLDGDAFTVRLSVFPSSPRSESDFEASLAAMERANLVSRHTFQDGRVVLQIIKFDDHQTGLHKRTASKFPEIPATSATSSEIPASCARAELNSTELKRTEQKAPAVSVSFDPHRPLITPLPRNTAWPGRPPVPGFLHNELLQRLGPGETERDLTAFYTRTSDAWADKAIGDDGLRFWRARFNEWKGTTVRPSAGPQAEERVTRPPGAAATKAMVAAMKPEAARG